LTLGLGFHLTDHILDPRAIEHGFSRPFDPRRGIHEGLAFLQQTDQDTVNAVNLMANIGHGFGGLRCMALLI